MAISGEAYVQVDLSAVNNGIATLSISGTEDPPAGSTEVTTLVLWRYDPDGNSGLTGTGWYEDTSDIPYTYTESTYQEHLNTLWADGSGEQSIRDALSTALAGWSSSAKASFLNGDAGHTLFNNGCIQWYG